VRAMQRCSIILAMAFAACGPTGMSGPSMNNRMTGTPVTATASIESQEILDREPRSNRTKVKHILISWKDKSNAFASGGDPRAAERSRRDAERQVRALQKQIEAGADFDVLMNTHSEDKGSSDGEAYDVTPEAGLVIEFRRLGLRLDLGEIGVVESDFGFHIIKRVE
jgi:parvulin-like peptidyl-prolyl isomerase